MKILAKPVSREVYFDSENYWARIADFMYGITIHNHIRKPAAEFEILPADKEPLKSSEKKVKIKVDDISKIAPQDRSKPSKYIDPDKSLRKALEGGD